MAMPETLAHQLKKEKQWEAAVNEWRRLIDAYPGEGAYRRQLGEALYEMGVERFLKEGNMLVGAPALFESVRYHAEVWYNAGLEKRIQAQAAQSLQRQGGLRHYIGLAQKEQDYYGAGMAFMVEQWTPWLAGIPRDKLEKQTNQLTNALKDKPNDGLLELELAAAYLLSAKPEQAAPRFTALKQAGKKLPIAVNLDAFIRYCTLITADETKWRELPIQKSDNWRQAGFSIYEADRWSREFENITEALPWWRKGYLPPEAGLWNSLNIAIGAVPAWRKSKVPTTEIKAWRQAGVSPADVMIWRRSGTPPEKVAAWVEAGYSAPEVVKLQNNIWKKFTPQEAKVWRQQGIVEIDDIFEWMQEGIVDPLEVARRLRKKSSPDAVKEDLPAAILQAWRALNFDRTEIAFWHPLGIEPSEARQWRDRGFDSQQAQEWVRSGIKPAVAQKWKHTGLSPLVVSVYAGDGLTPGLYKGFQNAGERKEWKSLSIPWKQAAAFKRFNIPPSEAKEWLETGYSAEEARVLVQSKFTPRQAGDWKAQGISKPHEMATWSRFGLSAQKAAVWRTIDCGGAHMAGRLAGAGMKPEDARIWLEHSVPLNTAEYYARAGCDAGTGLSIRNSNPQADGIVRSCASAGVRNLGDWLAVGFSLTREISQWWQARWTPEDAYPWWKYFCLPATAVLLKNKGERPEQLLPWHRGQPGWEQQLPAILQETGEAEVIISAWINDYYREAPGFATLEEAVPWIAAHCFDDGYMAAAWKREGYEIHQVKRWIAKGYTNPEWANDAVLEEK
ncbi:MAG: hypothetical protein GY757_44430 [bacterium]|nr:hypothetical protein [bacterium]